MVVGVGVVIAVVVAVSSSTYGAAVTYNSACGERAAHNGTTGEVGVRFVVYSDSVGGNDVHRELIGTVLGLDPAPAFVLHCGDSVDGSDVDGVWGDFFSIIQPACNTYPFFITMGNHDEPTDAWAERMSSELYYSFDWGLYIHVIVVNTLIDTDTGSAQYQWLQEDLASASMMPRWIFVIQHHPRYSTGYHGCQHKVEAFSELYATYNVTAAFQGHDHGYERIFPLNGYHSFVLGGGGETLRNQKWTDTWSAKFVKTNHFLIVDIVTENHLIFTAVKHNDASQVIETLELDNGKPYLWYGVEGGASTHCQCDDSWKLPVAIVVTAAVPLACVILAILVGKLFQSRIMFPSPEDP
ncbi:alkaline phosphatase precursor [Pelomyxa schiedti]|nr:alkaline phosphatase precursor [Pelomyxa schiedti]